jgi:hypothetical protein
VIYIEIWPYNTVRIRDEARILIRDVPAAHFWDRQRMRGEGVGAELLGRVATFTV